MTGRSLILPVLLVSVLTSVGCSRQPSPVTPAESASERERDVAADNLRVADAVALAKVHFDHEEYRDAERVLTEAIANAGAATNKADAISLLARVKSAAEAAAARPASVPVANGVAPPIPDPAGPPPAAGSTGPTVPGAVPVVGSRAAPPAAGGPENAEAEKAEETEVEVVEIAGDADEPPAEKRPATDAEVGRVLREAEALRSAGEALELLERFENRHSFAGDGRVRFEQELAAWRERAAKGLVRNGRDWVDPAEYGRAIAEADALVEQAFQLIRVGNAAASVELLEKAGRLDRNGIRADFVLGVIYAVAGPAALEKAERHFQEVLRREPNHISAMNNLAIVLVKQREYDPALRHWRRAIELAPKTPAVSQNLGRLVAAASGRTLPMTAATLRRFSNAYAELTASGKGLPADPRTGWLLMPLYLPEREQDRHGGGGRLVDIGSGSGFVVAGGYVLTNRHVVRDEAFGDHDAYAVIAPGDVNKEHAATLVAVSADADLAILRCPDLDAPPVPLESEPVARGSDVLILGYPEPGVTGVGLKLTQGIVTALPEPSNRGMLLFDATANPGNSGGPVLTRRGGACGVLTAIYLTEQGYSAGVPSTRAIEFVRKVLPDWKPEPVPEGRLEWSEADARVGPSTVRILCRRQQVQVAIGGDRDDLDGCLEDRSCCVCNGAGAVNCPAQGCVNGAVSVSRQVPSGVNPLTKRPIYETRFFRQPCPGCSGKGAVDCPHCHGGVDPAVR
ncbi:MAG TPA: trypsin-like peptidase domain-containing protein [Planctomycetaceae bacterium]